MKVRFIKLHPKAVKPTKAHPTDAGFDLTATSHRFDEYGADVYGTGIAVEIPAGYVGLVFPRSSVSKFDLSMANALVRYAMFSGQEKTLESLFPGLGKEVES